MSIKSELISCIVARCNICGEKEESFTKEILYSRLKNFGWKIIYFDNGSREEIICPECIEKIKEL